MVFATVVTAELFAIVLSLATVDSADQLLNQISLISLFVQWVALLGAGLLCLFRRWTKGLNDRLAGILAWTLLQCLVLIAAMVVPRIMPIGDSTDFVWRTLAIGSILSALVLRLHLHAASLAIAGGGRVQGSISSSAIAHPAALSL